MRTTIFFLLLLLTGVLPAQVAPGKYFIEFTDKNGTPYSIDHPEQFLSQRAIDRRNRQGIAVTEEDLPVNPDYVSAIAGTGMQVFTRSKWFNGITVECLDSTLLDTLSTFPFVKKVVKNRQIMRESLPLPDDKFALPFRSAEPLPGRIPENPSGPEAFDYGPSYNQIHMIHGDHLHDLGFRGKGMVIAVLDAGFFNADVLPAFDSLRANGRILGTRDFVNPGNNVYLEYWHGTAVLSVMGAVFPGQLIGTAPEASYWLLRSEKYEYEYLIEEYNWVAAAEFADSAGADLINSSLGYTQFDDPSQDHTCDDLRGNAAPSTRGANIAAGKGMVVVTSAGNSGEKPMKCVGAPADGYRVMGIAAVDSAGNYATFSSHGFINDTMVKPNVAAQGRRTVAAASDGSFIQTSGTSLSAPVITGAAACLWQTNPQSGWNRVIGVIEESASQYNNPDTLMGYGIPDFAAAMNLLSAGARPASLTRAFPNPFTSEICIEFFSATSGNATVTFYDLPGQVVLRKNIPVRVGENAVHLTGLGYLRTGFYIVTLVSSTDHICLQLLKVSN